MALAVAALVAGAQPAVGTEAANPKIGPGYIATDNVEWLGNIPFNTDSAGARIVGSHLFVTEDRGLTIYDVSKPEAPAMLSFTPAPQGAYFVEEDVDTNGSIVLIGTYGDLAPSVGPLDRLLVIDVTDKKAPKIVGELQGADSHTVSCVLACSYAYNSDGRIIDLRDPTKPTFTGTKWSDADGPAGVKGSHDVTEVAPGLVVTSSNPLLYLDARSDPARPTVLGSGSPGDRRFLQGRG